MKKMFVHARLEFSLTNLYPKDPESNSNKKNIVLVQLFFDIFEYSHLQILPVLWNIFDQVYYIGCIPM